MFRVITPAVAKVDATDERYVGGRSAWMSEYYKFLVMRTARPHPHVHETFAPGGFYLLSQMPVLLLAKLEAIKVRTPHQTPHIDTPVCCICENLPNLRARSIKPLVRISPPVGEQQEVARRHFTNAREKFPEVLRAVDEYPHFISLGPGTTIGVSPVQACVGITSLFRSKKPLLETHQQLIPRRRKTETPRKALSAWRTPAGERSRESVLALTPSSHCERRRT